MKQAFGAEEISREASPEGMIHHAAVRIGNSMIEMGEAHGELAQPMPPALFMYGREFGGDLTSAHSTPALLRCSRPVNKHMAALPG